jgi:hypothetical protein
MDLRKLDALVAEKVMGTEKYWSVIFGGSHYGNFDSVEKAQDRANKIQGDYKAAIVPYYDEPNYSTSIEAAWQVVETLDGEWSIFGQHHLGWEVSPVEASMREDRYGNPFKANAETAPLAICLASLRSKGIDVSEWEK